MGEGETPILRNISLNIASGEWIGIAGRNGCGKSVLGKLIAGVEGRYTGEIHRPENETVQLIMQNPESQLVGSTVWEEVIFGPENYGLPAPVIAARAEAALHKTGLAHLKHREVHQLSGGQKQLLALAGAIALEPSVIVADEITSMLDPASRGQVIQVLRELNRQGVTILYITQLLEELAHVGRVIAVDQGRIGYDGCKEAFFYPEGSQGASVCESIGLLPPYTVRVARELIRQGVLPQKGNSPITPEELEEAVGLR